MENLKSETYGGYEIIFGKDFDRVYAKVDGINNFKAQGKTKQEAFDLIKQLINRNEIKGIKRKILKVGDVSIIKDNIKFSINQFGVLYIYENDQWRAFIFSNTRRKLEDKKVPCKYGSGQCDYVNVFESELEDYLKKYLSNNGFLTRRNQNDNEYYTSPENYKRIKGVVIR